MDLKSERYRITHEYLNIASHFIGFVFSIIGFYYLYTLSTDSRVFWSTFIYCSSLSLVFLSSTVYHFLSLENKGKKVKVAQIWDHIMIFFLIAGTYTPFIIIKMQSSASTYLLITLWSLVLIGTILKLFYLEKTKTLGLVIYLVMGLLSVFFLDELNQELKEGSLLNIKAGGILYLIGVVFYKIKKIPFNHFIWHLFVMVGSYLMYLAVVNETFAGN